MRRSRASCSACSFPRAEPVSVAERLEGALHPLTSFVIVPVFALANAGIRLSGDAVMRDWSITGGVLAGLVLGKIVGITGAAWLTIRFGLGSLPSGTTWRHLIGVAGLAGIGFTVSLFVTDLAFADSVRQQQAAKVGVLLASVVAAVLGSTLLVLAAARRRDQVS